MCSVFTSGGISKFFGNYIISHQYALTLVYMMIFIINCPLFVEIGYSAGLADDLSQAVQIDEVQPSSDYIKKIERMPREGEAGVKQSTEFSTTDLPYQLSTILMVNSLPYYPYYALKGEAKHVVHPMAIGRFLLRNASGAMAGDVMRAALDIAFELPNGGLAWYYPRHYKVARMLGEHLKYSSISQGTIIAGLSNMARENENIGFEHAQKAFKAMCWPFEKGGVNLADKAVLEMPSFNGPPEIILNGWIDALLHICDYAQISGDQQAQQLFLSNVEFLAKILPNFDSREAHISRYSDLSPYRAKIRLAAAEDFDNLRILYRPKFKELPSIVVPLMRTKNLADFSIYENQIVRQNGKVGFVWLSCSQLYDTVLISDSATMSVEIETGSIGRKQASPGFGGATLVFEGKSENQMQYIDFGANNGLIRGYPTNFLKGGKENYYHVYHVVGLMLLALSPEIKPQIRDTLLKWSFAWLEDIDYITKSEKLLFHGTQDMLDDINANKAIVTYTEFSKLLDAAHKTVGQ